MLRLQALEPEELIVAPQAGIGLLCEARELERVAIEQPILLARLRELLARELADRLEHRESRLAAGFLGLAEQAAVDQRGDAFQDVELACSGDALGRLEGESAHEHRQPGMEAALLVVQ